MKKHKKTADPFSPIRKLSPHIIQIDILKAFAIIAVILLHALPLEFFIHIGSPYHLWHAVPLLILIAGFTSAYAYKRYGFTTLKQCYSPSLILKRYKRLLIPFLICWIVEIAILFSIHQLSPDIVQVFLSLTRGGYGWGAYFIPVILQSILIVPLLYLLARQDPTRMVVIALCISVLFDAVCILMGWNTDLTSFLYLRFMFAGALGVWLVTTDKYSTSWIVAGAGISLLYLTVSTYTPLLSAFPDYTGYGGVLQTPAFIWTAIIVITGIIYLPKDEESRTVRYLSEIGKASWHIFLAQLLYYFLPAAYVYAYIVDPLSSGNMALQYILIVVCNLPICIGIGYVWYSCEKRIVK
jgi:peptidoglycan/LPS O-acetylase OafA/YrhL